MAEDLTPCRRRGAANPPHNRFCGQCGHPWGGVPPGAVPSEGEEDRDGLLPALGEPPPAQPAGATAAGALARLGAAGKPLAVGVLALAAEAAAVWLARRAGRGVVGPPPATRRADPAVGAGGFVPEGYYEEVLLVVTQGGTRPGRLLARRSGVFGQYTTDGR